MNTTPSLATRLALTTVLLFLVFVAFKVYTVALPQMVLWAYLGASAACFIAYYIDKSAAINRRWRTPENTLHLLALIGGWPGALIAQRLLRHKSRKTSFQLKFWASVLLNCTALGYWLKLHAA